MVKVIVPQIGQSIAEATIVKWFRQPGDPIEKGETLVEIGTDKINTEIPAPESGVVERLLVQEGETVPILTEIAELKATSVSPEKLSEPPLRQTLEPSPDSSQPASGARLSPVVRKLAQENNIDLSTIRGTGDAGRITKEDVQKVIAESSSALKEGAIDRTAGELREIQPMSRMRKLIADHMLGSKRATAELTTFFEIDMTEVARERERARDIYLQQHSLKLTFLPFVMVAVAKALRAFPILNSSVEGENIHYKRECNLGIATSVQGGLVVPVIRNADGKNVLSITRITADLAERARTNRLSPDDLSDGTFTITNPGAFGALLGTPIINYPQVAILGVGAVEKRAVVKNDAIAIRSMAYFSLTYDHRAMDGADADGFMAFLKRTLETSCPPALES